MKRTEYISIRCTPSQKRLLSALAKQEGRSVSNFVMQVMAKIAAQSVRARKTKAR